MARRLVALGHEAIVVCREPARVIARGFGDRQLPLREGTLGDEPALVDAESGVHVLPWDTAQMAVPGPFNAHELLEQGLALEREYDIPNWRSEVSSEHLYEDRVVEDCAPELLAFYPAWERLLDRWTPDAVFTGDGGDNVRTSLLHCLIRRGIPLFYQVWTPVPGRTYLGSDNQYGVTCLPLDDEHPETADELTWAESHIRGVRESSLDSIIKRPPPALAPGLRHVWRLVTGRQTFAEAHSEWSKRMRGRVAARRVARHVQEPRDEPFAFFPLHLADDAQLTVRSPLLAAQFTVIDMLARSLPVGMTLYLKEHPALLSSASDALFAPVLRMANVRLIHPRWHPYDLIRRSRLVCVLNSTAGLEALILGRPVVCLSRPFYANWGLTHDWTEALSLPALIRQALRAPLPAEKDIVRLLCRLRRHSYPSVHWLFDATDANAALTADSLLCAIEDRRRAQGS